MSPVSKLSRSLGRLDLGNADARDAFLREAHALVDFLDRPEEVRARSQLQVAILLTYLIEDGPPAEARAMDAMVRRLVSWASKAAGTGGGAAPAGPRPALPSSNSAHQEYERLGQEVDRSVGKILVRMGETSEDDVRKADRTRCQGEHLGEALVRSGKAPERAVEEALRLQTNLVRETALQVETSKVVDEWCLGEVLVRLTWITRETLNKALKIQHASGLRLGDALVETGALTRFQINDALRIQKRERQRRGL